MSVTLENIRTCHRFATEGFCECLKDEQAPFQSTPSPGLTVLLTSISWISSKKFGKSTQCLYNKGAKQFALIG